MYAPSLTDTGISVLCNKKDIEVQAEKKKWIEADAYTTHHRTTYWQANPVAAHVFSWTEWTSENQIIKSSFPQIKISNAVWKQWNDWLNA